MRRWFCVILGLAGIAIALILASRPVDEPLSGRLKSAVSYQPEGWTEESFLRALTIRDSSEEVMNELFNLYASNNIMESKWSGGILNSILSGRTIASHVQGHLSDKQMSKFLDYAEQHLTEKQFLLLVSDIDDEYRE